MEPVPQTGVDRGGRHGRPAQHVKVREVCLCSFGAGGAAVVGFGGWRGESAGGGGVDLPALGGEQVMGVFGAGQRAWWLGEAVQVTRVACRCRSEN